MLNLSISISLPKPFEPALKFFFCEILVAVVSFLTETSLKAQNLIGFIFKTLLFLYSKRHLNAISGSICTFKFISLGRCKILLSMQYLPKKLSCPFT